MGIRVNTGTVGKKAATELLLDKRSEALAYNVLADVSGESANSAGMALTSAELQKFLESTGTAQAPAAVQAEGPAFAVPTPIAGEFRVNTFTTGDQANSAVTALDGGGFLVTWNSNGQDGSGNGIYGQRYTAAGVADGGEFRVNTFTTNSQIYVSASALIGGGFVVTWSSNSQDGSGYGIYGQRYTAAGVADGGEFRVNTFTTGNQIFSAVTTLNGGGFVVTWTSNGQDGSGDGIYGQRYTAAGVADGGEFRVNSFITNSQNFSAVAALDNGGFVVTWMSGQQDGSADGIYAQRYTSAGVADGSEFRVNTFTSNTQGYSSVAGLDGGGFVVTWSSDGQDGSGYGIYGQRYTAAGVADGGEFRINTFTNSTQFFPSVTALNGGGFLVTWSSDGQDGDSYGVYGQRYDAAGVADGAEFRVNETTVGFQFNDVVPHQSVTQLADGSLITTWFGNGIGDTSGVFARRFALAAPNDPPAGTDATLTINEDTARVLTVADFGFTDTDGDALLSVGITTLPGAGTIRLNGTAVTAGTFVSAADIIAGLLVYTPGSNGNGTAYSSFTFQVRDDGGSTDTDLSANTISFDVTAVNDAPTIANLQGDVSTQTEDDGMTPFADTGRNAVITDVDSANFDGGRLTVAITAGFQTSDSIYIFGDGVTSVGAGNVVTVNGIAVGVVSGGAGDFPSSPTLTIDLNGNATAALVQTLLRGIFVRDPRIEPVSGVRDIQVTLTDGDGGQSSYTTQLNVVAINDEPFGTDANVTINEDGSHVFTRANFGFDAGGFTSGAFHIEEDQQFLTVKITTLPTAGTLTLNGAVVLAGAMIAVSDLDAGNLVFTPAANANGAGYASLTFQVQDDGGTSNGGIDTDQSPNTLTFNVTAVVDAPVVTNLQGDTASFNEGGASVVALDNGLNTLVTDADNVNFNGGSLTIAVTGGNAAEDFIYFDESNPAFGLSFSGNTISQGGVAFATFNAPGSTRIFTFLTDGSATPARVEQLMRSLSYFNSNGYNPTAGAHTVTYTLTDGSSGTSVTTSTVTVIAVNTAPELDLNTGTSGINDTNGYSEGSFAAGIGTAIAISDDGNLTRATVTITDAVAGDALTVNLPLPAGITVDPSSTATNLILVGNASTSAFATALGQVGYLSTSDDPTVQGTDATRSVQVVVSDGALDSAPATMTITVVAVNDAPTVTMSFNAPVIDQSALDLSSGHNISSFVQANNFTISGPTTLNRFTVFLAESTAATAGTFEGFGGTLSFAVYRDNGSGLPGTLILTGSDSAPVATDTGFDLGGRDLFRFAVNLGGVTLTSGNYWLALHEGAWLSPSDGTDIFWSRSANDTNNNQRANTSNVTAPNGTFATFTPGLAFALVGAPAATEQTAYDLKGKISVADGDAGSNVVTATLSVGYGVIKVNVGTSGATIVSGNNTGTIVLSGTIAQLNALLNTNATSAIRYTANTDTPPGSTALSVSVNDGGSFGSGGAQTGMATQTISIIAVNDVPVVDLNGAAAGIDTTGSYTEGGAAITPLLGMTISDVDNSTLSGATVSIATGFVTGDILRLSGGFSGTTASGITFGYNSTTGVLTLSGVASVADYQAALATLAFKSNSDDPGTARDITVVVNDGTSNSVAANIALTVSPINDAPINNVPAGQTTTSGDSIVFSVASGNALSVSDADAGSGMVRVRLSVEHGTLTLASTVGVTVTGDGTGIVKITGTLSAINAALNGLTYQGSAGYVGTDALVITTNDTGNTGSGGFLTDTDSIAIMVDPAVSQTALSDKLFADGQDSNISAAFASNDDSVSHNSLAGMFHPAGSADDMILGSSIII